MDFFVEHFFEIFFGLISAGALGFCKHLVNQIKDYKKLLELRENESVVKTIEEQITPVKSDLEKKIDLVLDRVEELKFATEETIKELEDKIQDISDEEHFHIEQILRSWRFRIIQLCELYLEQGYMTQQQFTQLSEMYALYKALGGNGRVTDYYEKTKALKILPNEIQ